MEVGITMTDSVPFHAQTAALCMAMAALLTRTFHCCPKLAEQHGLRQGVTNMFCVMRYSANGYVEV